MASNSEKIIKGFTVLLIILLAVASIFNLTFDEKGIKNDETFKLVKKNIDLNDLRYIDSTSNILSRLVNEDKYIENLQNKLSLADDKLKLLKTSVDEKGKAVVKIYRKDIQSIVKSKNNTVYEYEEYKIKSHKINYWLIALIILTAGILGGWARINYALLIPIKEDLQSLVKKMIEIKKAYENRSVQATNLPTNEIKLFKADVDDIGEKTETVKEKINKILLELPTKKDRVNTSIVFGIIASSIAILALKLTDSKVLEFNDKIDYFILWAWCLLGAVYAKDSLEKLYNKYFGAIK